MNSFFVWAAKEPWTFLYYVLIFLSPFFLISGENIYPVLVKIGKWPM